MARLESSTTETNGIEIGFGRSGNGFAYFDLIGDATYTDYGFRFIRQNSGPNASTELNHRGTGTLLFRAEDAGNMAFYTNNAERVYIKSNGFVGFNQGNPLERIHLGDGNIYLPASNLSRGALS